MKLIKETQINHCDNECPYFQLTEKSMYCTYYRKYIVNRKLKDVGFPDFCEFEDI